MSERLDDVTLARSYRKLHRKALVVAAWYLASYLAIIYAPGLFAGVLACTSLAFAMAGVGFNIQHDANHNAFFDPRGTKRLTRANRLAGWALAFIGASPTRWISGHVIAHHAAPNVVGRDADIDMGPLARVAPAQAWRPWHRYQHLYIWVLYSLTAIFIIVGDVTATASEALRREPGKTPTPLEWFKLLLPKTLFFAALLVVPALVHPLSSVLYGAAYVSLLTGLVIAVVFQSAHVLEEAAFATGKAPQNWHAWQVMASLDFSHHDTRRSRALRWYIGGLDHQAEHHLFPRLPHTAYPLIATGGL